jgi:type II secretory pathway component PulF
VYPIVIIALSLGMIGVFMVYVIPKIQKMYKDSKVNLPELTTTVIQISEFMQNNITEIIIGVIIFLILFSTFKKHPKTKIHFDHMILKVPLF